MKKYRVIFIEPHALPIIVEADRFRTPLGQSGEVLSEFEFLAGERVVANVQKTAVIYVLEENQ